MKIRPQLILVLSLSALALTGCQEKISGSIQLTEGGADHFLVRDVNGSNRKVYAGKTSFAAESSGEITIENADREIEIKVPGDLIPRDHRQAFEFHLPRQRTGQPLDIVGQILSEDIVRDEVIERESCHQRVCRRQGRDTTCWSQPGWRMVRVNRVRTVQKVQITFSAPTEDGSTAPVGIFSGKRAWVEDSSRREIGRCHY